MFGGYLDGAGRGARASSLAMAVAILAGPAPAQDAAVMAQQWAEYQTNAPKNILDLQPFRTDETGTLASGTPIKLISLAPDANAWFVLQIGKGNGARDYHLENPDPRGRTISLQDGPSLALTENGRTTQCAPWQGSPSELEKARDSHRPFANICGGALYLRNTSSGSSTFRQAVADFLRNNVWGGDQVVQFIKNQLFHDAFAQKDQVVAGAGAGTAAAGLPSPPLSKEAAAHPSISTGMKLTLAGTKKGEMDMGSWYPVAGVKGVYASAIRPEALASSVLDGPGKANPLDKVEARASDYLVAFDLSQFDMGYALGTDHPQVDWSPRPPASVRRPGMPGPDGIGNWKPLVRLGMVPPNLTSDTVATFTGGFKRNQGAFKWGPFSKKDGGTHYGFLEQGVIFSKLHPGLSTLYVLDDGTIGMKTWTKADNAMLRHLRFARQNGVPLVVTDPKTAQPVPGPLVTDWGGGNWSGSAEAALRTLRAGACMVQTPSTRYFVYGYFSTATPSAMARVFQAYGCQYAMLLDMNAPELTYMAVYARHQGKMAIEHLVQSMEQSDKRGSNGALIPRFLGFPDSRDFFYLTRKK